MSKRGGRYHAFDVTWILWVWLLSCSSAQRDDDFASEGVRLNVDWPSFLGRSDPVWLFNSSSPISVTPHSQYSSAFVGNGNIGAMMWMTTNATSNSSLVRVDISRTDVYDTRKSGSEYALGDFVYDRPRLPIGHFLFDLQALVTQGSMRLHLYDAIARGHFAAAKSKYKLSCSLLLIAHSQADAFVLDTNCTTSTSEQVAATDDADSSNSTKQQLSRPPAPILSFVSMLARSTWTDDNKYVPNPPAVYQLVDDELHTYEQTLLGGGYFTTAYVTDTLKCQATEKKQADEADKSAAEPDALASFCQRTFISISPVLTSPLDTLEFVLTQITSLRSSSSSSSPTLSTLLASHTAFWHAFYPQSFLSLANTRIESFWWIQMYKLASAAQPNRTLFDLQGPWFVDGTYWPDLHWDLNLQLVYYPVFTTNHIDLFDPVVARLRDVWSSNFIDNVPQQFQSDSAAAPATGSALDGLTSCYWDYGVDCFVTSPTITGNLLFMMHMYYLYLLHTDYKGDGKALQDFVLSTLYPTLRRAVNYHCHLLELNTTDALYHLPITFSPEYPGKGPDTTYDLALFQWGVTFALQLNERYAINETMSGEWKAKLQRLVPFPTDENGWMIASTVPFTESHRHYSHLFALYPLLLVDFDDSDEYALAQRSFDWWVSKPDQMTGFARTAIATMSMLFDRNEEAGTNVTLLMDTWIQPNTFYAENGGPCGETPPALASSISDLFLFSRRGLIEVFPSVLSFSSSSSSSLSFYHFRTVGGFLVSALKNASDTQFIEIINVNGNLTKQLLQFSNYPNQNDRDEEDSSDTVSVSVKCDWDASMVTGRSSVTGTRVNVVTSVVDAHTVRISFNPLGFVNERILLYLSTNSHWVNASDSDFVISPNAGTENLFGWWGSRQGAHLSGREAPANTLGARPPSPSRSPSSSPTFASEPAPIQTQLDNGIAATIG